MRIVIISDTHNHRIALPPGDVLVHCGDCTNRGTTAEFATFAGWFRGQPHPH
jgi:3',5'-cyclic AMP phosphodiesterase CpdA